MAVAFAASGADVATAKDTTIEALFRSGVFQNMNGKAALTPREKLPEKW